MRAAVDQTLRTGKDYEIEYRNVWPDGTIHWTIRYANRHPCLASSDTVSIGIDNGTGGGGFRGADYAINVDSSHTATPFVTSAPADTTSIVVPATASGCLSRADVDWRTSASSSACSSWVRAC